jgi:hypothetical protein
MATDALRDVREQIQSGAFDLAPDARQAVLARLDDLIVAVDAANQAVRLLPKPAIGEAAARLASVRYATGHGWRRYTGSDPATAAAAAEICSALNRTVAEPVESLARFLSVRAPEPVRRTDTGGYALPCAACGGDAITLTVEKVSPVLQEQMVVTSLSPVTVFRSLSGPRMADLLGVLDGGDVAAVVKHLRDTQPGGCDVYCPDCDRVYCRTHYAVEAQWSGSWHEATYATCPLGHEHTID